MSILSIGLGVPLAGGLGAGFIHALFFYQKNGGRKGFWSFAGWGALSSLVGLVFYNITTKDVSDDWLGFGVIIALWQLAVGILYIRTLDRWNKNTAVR